MVLQSKSCNRMTLKVFGLVRTLCLSKDIRTSGSKYSEEWEIHPEWILPLMAIDLRAGEQIKLH